MRTVNNLIQLDSVQCILYSNKCHCSAFTVTTGRQDDEWVRSAHYEFTRYAIQTQHFAETHKKNTFCHI
jgi:hypothetical protein